VLRQFVRYEHFDWKSCSKLQFANFRPVHFMCCEQTVSLGFLVALSRSPLTRVADVTNTVCGAVAKPHRYTYVASDVHGQLLHV